MVGDYMKISTIIKNRIEKYLIAVILIFILGVLPILYFYYTTILYRTWAEWFSKCAVMIPFFIIFLGGTVFFIVMIFKRPKKFNAILLEKKINKEGILELFFEVKGYQKQYLSCLVEKDNDFNVGEYYLLTIKEVFEMILYIEDNNNEKSNDTSFERIINHKDFPLYFGVLAVEFVLLFLIVLCIIGLILYPKYFYIYIIVAIILILTLFRVYILFKDKINKK